MNSDHPKAVKHFQAAREILGTIKHPETKISGLDQALAQLATANKRLARIIERKGERSK